MNKIAGIYARVSSQRQKEGETIESQLDALRKYAKEQGYVVPEGFEFIDAGYSGTLLERPGLDALRDIVNDAAIDTILVYSPDRLSRKYVYQLLLQDEFEKKKVELRFINSPVPTTPEEQFAQHFQGVFAEYERAQIMERSRRGRIYKAKQGDPSVLPKMPYGYKRFKDGGRSYIEIDEDQARIVNEIFNLYAVDGLSLMDLCRNLHLRNIPSPTGKTTWNRVTLMRLLKNPVYVGMGYYGKTEKIKGSSGIILRSQKGIRGTSQYIKKKKAPEQWYEIPFPRLIDEERFQKAQERLQINQQFSRRNTKEMSLLQGILVCNICGMPYYKKTRGKTFGKCTRYICKSRLESGLKTCGNRNIPTEQLDDLVWKNVLMLLQNPDLVEKEVQRRLEARPGIQQAASKKKDIEKSLSRLKKAKDKLLDAYQNSDCLTLEELRKRMNNMVEQIRSLEGDLEALNALQINSNVNTDINDILGWFKKQLDVAKNSLSDVDKRKVVRLLIEEVIIGKQSIKIKHCIPMSTNHRDASPLRCANLQR